MVCGILFRFGDPAATSDRQAATSSSRSDTRHSSSSYRPSFRLSYSSTSTLDHKERRFIAHWDGRAQSRDDIADAGHGRLRRSRLKILPTVDFGKASTKRTILGIL